jgi:hypothetical protein
MTGIQSRLAVVMLRAVQRRSSWTGWLRLVNSAGSPEFWFFTRD